MFTCTGSFVRSFFRSFSCLCPCCKVILQPDKFWLLQPLSISKSILSQIDFSFKLSFVRAINHFYLRSLAYTRYTEHFCSWNILFLLFPRFLSSLKFRTSRQLNVSYILVIVLVIKLFHSYLRTRVRIPAFTSIYTNMWKE